MPEASVSPTEATPEAEIDPLGEPCSRLKRYTANPDLAVCLELARSLRCMQDTLADEIEGDADRLGTRCGSLAILAQGLAEIDPRSKKPPRNCLSVAIAKAAEIRAGKKAPSPVGAKRFAAATSNAASLIRRRKLLKAMLDEMPGAADFFRRILVELSVLHPSFLYRLELSDIDPDVFDGDWDGFFDVLRQAVAKAEETGDVNATEVIDGVIDRVYAKPEDWKLVVRRLGDDAATLIREIERDAPRFTDECGSRILEIHEACGGRFWAFSRSLRDAAAIAKVSGETDVKVIVSNAVSATPAAAKSKPIEYVVCENPDDLIPPALRVKKPAV